MLVEDRRVFQSWPSGARSSCIVHSIEDGRDGVQGVVAPKFVRFTPRVRLSCFACSCCFRVTCMMYDSIL